MSTSTEEIHPFVWWVKIKHVPDAPDEFVLRKNGSLIGRWRDRHGGAWVHLMSDDRMRLYGYEKCFCDPFGGPPAPDCIAHAGAGMKS
jgi:hypothetical protein